MQLKPLNLAHQQENVPEKWIQGTLKSFEIFDIYTKK